MKKCKMLKASFVHHWLSSK